MRTIERSRSGRVSKVTPAKPSVRFHDTGRLKSSSRRTPAKARPKATDLVFRIGKVSKTGKLTSVYPKLLNLHAARAAVAGTKLSILYPGDYEGQKPAPKEMAKLKGKAWYNLYDFRDLEHDARWPERYSNRKVALNRKRQFELYVVLNQHGEVEILTTDEVYAGSTADPQAEGWRSNDRTVYAVTVSVPKDKIEIQPAKVRYPLVAKSKLM